MKTLFKIFISCAAFATVLTTGSCTKDALYDVNYDTTLVQNDTTNIHLDSMINSIAFVSNNYSNGLSSFGVNGSSYYYDGVPVGGSEVIENIFRSNDENTDGGKPSMTLRLNPSKASINEVTWSIIKRNAKLATATKIVEGDILYTGEVIVMRSVENPAEIKVYTTENKDNFFTVGDAIYCLVATYKDGSQVVSNIATFSGKYEEEYQLTDLRIGEESSADTPIQEPLSKTITASDNNNFIAAPIAIAKSKDDNYYTLDNYRITDYTITATETVSDPNIKITQSKNTDGTIKGWEIALADGSPYTSLDDFNSNSTITIDLYNSEGVHAHRQIVNVVTLVGNTEVNTTVDRDITDAIIYTTKNVIVEGYDMDSFASAVYGNANYKSDFNTNYRDIDYIIDGEKATSQDVELIWSDVEYDVRVNKELGEGEHIITIVMNDLKGDATKPQFTHNLTVEVTEIPEITYPMEITPMNFSSYGELVDGDYQISVALNKLFENTYPTTSPSEGYTYKLAFSSTNPGSFIVDGKVTSELSGKYSELQTALDNVRVALSAILTVDKTNVEVTLKTYFGTQLKDIKEATIKFNNPISVTMPLIFEINSAAGSSLDLKDGLTIEIESGDSAPYVVYKNSSMMSNPIGDIAPEFTTESLISGATINSNGVVTISKDMSGRSNIGNVNIKVAVDAFPYGAEKVSTPKISVK